MDNSGENSYQKVENEMVNYLNSLSFSTDQDAIQEKMDKFMEKYLFKSDYLRNYSTSEYIKRNSEKLRFHFAFKNFFDVPQRYFKFHDRSKAPFYDHFRSDLDRIFSNDLEYFIYPHSKLNSFYTSANMSSQKYMKILKRISPEPMSKDLIKKWEKAVFLYKKLEELKDDDEKWFSCLQEWDDQEFVIHSMEYKIGKNLYNKVLWKLYIEFWRSKNPKIMVGVYSRYCSFFLDDLEMKKEYKKEAEKLGIFVKNDEEMLLLDYREFRSFPLPTLPPKIKYFIPKMNFNNYFCQSLPFHNSFINYLMDNCNPEFLLKLFKSCKYFFKKRPTPICHRLVLAKDQRFEKRNDYFEKPENPDPFIFEKQALTISDYHSCLNKLNYLYLTNTLHIAESFDDGLLSKIIPKIYQSKIKYLTIENHTIELKDYIFLTKFGTVKKLVFHKSKIINSDGSLAFLEDVMETLPNANFIDLRNCMTRGCDYSRVVTINEKRFKKLASMPRNTKMYLFFLGGCNIEDFNINDFFDFMKINVILEYRNSEFAVHFNKHKNGIDILKTIVETLTNFFKAFEIPQMCRSAFSPTRLSFSIFSVDFPLR